MSRPHNIIIRVPHRAEASLVFSLLRDYAAFDGSTSSFNVTVSSLELELFGDNPTLFAIVAEHNEELIGLMLYYFSFSSWQMKKCVWIEDLYIIDSYRGKGIGRLLVEHARHIALANDCARVDWHVRKVNDHAKDFYEHMGATIDGETLPVYWPCI